MPPIKWLSGPKKPVKPVPPPDMVANLFTRYMTARGITSAQLGAALNMSAEAVRGKKHRGTWTVEDVRAWCKALGIDDPEEVGKAVLNRV